MDRQIIRRVRYLTYPQLLRVLRAIIEEILFREGSYASDSEHSSEQTDDSDL